MPLEWWPQGGGSALGQASGMTCLSPWAPGQSPPLGTFFVLSENWGEGVVGHILSVPSSLELLGS